MAEGLALVALVAAAAAAGWWGRPGAVALAAASLLWLLVNKPMEGEILVVVDDEHGLTAGDLAGLTGLVLAAVLLVLPRRS